MGPLDMVLVKDALCAVLERHWNERKAPERLSRVLRCGDDVELEAVYKALGLEMMERGRKEGAKELVAAWRAREDSAPSGDQWRAAPEEEDEEDDQKSPSLAKGIAAGLGKAFGKAEEGTTEQIASASTGDHLGAVTEWQGEDEMSAAARRLFSEGKMSCELAKAEIAAVARAKLGSRADRMVDLVERSADAQELGLAVGEAQRKLVRAGMPRLAAKMAKKWFEMRSRVE